MSRKKHTISAANFDFLFTLVPRFINTVTFVANATVSSSRSDDDAMSMRIAEEEGQRNRRRPVATLWAEGVAGDLCVPLSSPMSLHRLLFVP